MTTLETMIAQDELDEYVNYYCEFCGEFHNLPRSKSVLIDGFYYCEESVNEVEALVFQK